MGVSFLTVGNFNIDNTVSADGSLSLRKLGGNAVYSAIGAHIWSGDVGIVSVIPENFSQKWLDELQKAGIDLSGIRKAPPPVDLEEWFFYRPDGSRIDHIYAPYQLFHQFRNRKDVLSKDEVEQIYQLVSTYPQNEGGISFGEFRRLNPIHPTDIPQSWKAIHACHIAPNSFAIHKALSLAFKQLGIFVSLDPGIYVNQLTEMEIASLLSQVDVFLPSHKELTALYPEMDPELAILRLSEMGPKAIVAKIGAQGSLVWDCDRKKVTHIPPVASKVIDLTGAGDAYCGGFLVGMIETSDAVMAAHYGSVSSSLVIEKTSMQKALRFNRYQASTRLKSAYLHEYAE
jgi:ribokinase